MAKVSPLERNLISLVGTMVHLKKYRKLVESRPIIPVHMESIMLPVKPSVDNILASFKQAETDTQKLAETWICQWLTSLGTSIGGMCSVRHATDNGDELQVQGRVHAARLGDKLVEGSWRAVELTLFPFDITVLSGLHPGLTFPSTGAKGPGRGYESLHKIMRKSVVSVDGRTEQAFLLNVPIHQKVRDSFARGYYEKVLFL